ncbi:MAG: hypothetical protein QM820_11650 [Minicystis sp.]
MTSARPQSASHSPILDTAIDHLIGRVIIAPPLSSSRGCCRLRAAAVGVARPVSGIVGGFAHAQTIPDVKPLVKARPRA